MRRVHKIDDDKYGVDENVSQQVNSKAWILKQLAHFYSSFDLSISQCDSIRPVQSI